MTIPDDAIRNDAGQIAMKWILNRPARTLKIDGTDRFYVFVYKQNVPMIWVEPQDVERILAVREKTCNCNNGTYQQAVVYANLIDSNLHKCGDRNCD